MRDAFAKEITDQARQDERIVLLSGDIGNRMFNRFKENNPDRFFNCGVAEANMTGMAAGLASLGMRPITYTITPFVTTRCLEQIRVDVCYHNLPVVIVAVGAGYAYASLGATHHACEDIAFLRSLPGMTVICPGDAREVRMAVRAAIRHDGPVYIRMGKKGEPVVHAEDPPLVLGKVLVLQPGDDVALLSTGNLLPVADQAGRQLAQQGIKAEVTSFHTVKPLDADYLAEVFQRTKLVVTIEEHSLMGGFGSAVAEWKADHNVAGARLLRLGTPDRFPHEAGEQNYFRVQFGLTPEAIAEKVGALLDAGS